MHAAAVIGKDWRQASTCVTSIHFEVVVEVLLRIQEEVATMSTWVQANERRFINVDKDWFPFSAECERAQVLLQDMVRVGKALFLQALT